MYQNGQFAKNLRALREQAELTQVELAEETGLTEAAIAYWEADRVLPRVLSLDVLADFFGVSMDALLGREVLVLDEEEPKWNDV